MRWLRMESFLTTLTLHARLTGKYSHANGCIDNEYALFENQQTLASTLGLAGYRTAFVGKWHLGPGPYPAGNRHGFDYIAANNCNHDHYAISYCENETGPFQIDTWGPTGETDIALRFMDDHQRASGDGVPFGLVISWGPPHWGPHCYDEYPEQFNVYDPETVDLPPNVPTQIEKFARRELAHYYGNISGLDHEVGRIVAFLKERGLEDNTILCYSSDHGDHLSSHGYGKPTDKWLHHSKRASKATPYEESVHVPLILRYPAK
jgi:arylsulfatase A-like enzyme